ncbi:DUF1428 family protein [Candidatus Campbellbacteria bacterium]|nr:MAG: DUF1428 family protein [Candidatus Campbellbacteria bacterium]
MESLFLLMFVMRPGRCRWFFSWIVFKSKADRNRINKEVMKGMEEYQKKHPEKKNDMPFDMKKMAYGGFKIIVSE